MTAPTLPDLVVLDSGALERVETKPVLRAMLHRLLEHGADVEIPTITLAEAITGTPRDAPVHRLVKRVGTLPTDEVVARRAGAMRHTIRQRRKRTPSAVDAIVAAHAALGVTPALVLTTDKRDLSVLAASCRNVIVEKI